MKTIHSIRNGAAKDQLRSIPDDSVNLVATSPPYPMIEMWDGVFDAMCPGVAEDISHGRSLEAFEKMHKELDSVWAECFRVLAPGGIACINIGDATRTIAGEFRLFHNHARIITAAAEMGFTVLPDILWRKPSNGPNKFMGSGMLPAGAYVTYEHEYILILRKGNRREFKTPGQSQLRRESAFFWEERNVWFSDVWTDLRGAPQGLLDVASRSRSAAFPYELARRLVLMFSVYGDTVLDPFVGTGTTMAAAAACGRSSIGVEIEPTLHALIRDSIRAAKTLGQKDAVRRLADHGTFVRAREQLGKTFKHKNLVHQFPVVTRQESEIELRWPILIEESGTSEFQVTHEMASIAGSQLSFSF